MTVRGLAMAAWCRRALELFPDLSEDLTDPGYTVYLLFFDLLPMAMEAHGRDDGDRLRGVYGFAEWCSRQTAKDLWNAAGVAFYEHLFDRPEHTLKVAAWLSPSVVFTHWSLWEAMLPPAEWSRVRRLLEDKQAAGAAEFHRQRRV
jgi:hypothetical protein